MHKNKLFINKFFFCHYINYYLNRNNSKYSNNTKDFSLKKINIEDKNIIYTFNYKNLLIEPYLIDKVLKIIKYNKLVDFKISENFLYYKISCFFLTRKYHPRIKKLKNIVIKKKLKKK